MTGTIGTPRGGGQYRNCIGSLQFPDWPGSEIPQKTAAQARIGRVDMRSKQTPKEEP